MIVMRQLEESDFVNFLREKEYAAILFDASWDTGPGRLIRPILAAAESQLGEQVSFGALDVDRAADVARSVQIHSVPTLILYRNERILRRVIGVQSNLVEIMTAMIVESDKPRANSPWTRMWARFRDKFVRN